jgi:diguanylate cyclase
MTLDPQTLLAVNIANLATLALLLSGIMGRDLSDAARTARRSIIVHAGAWIAVILSELCSSHWLNLALSTLSMACYSGSNWLLFTALGGWLGPRRYGRALRIAVVAMPIGYALLFESYALRVGWSNLLIAIQVGILACATLIPSTKLVGRWRLALLACFVSMALLTLARGILGAFFSADYPSFAAPHPVNLAALLVTNISLIVSSVAILVAWREEAEQELRDQAMLDPLTGLLNRRGWSESASQVFAHAARHNQPLALLSLDLDHFKRINDTHGHEAGDAALSLFAEILGAHRRAGDLIARVLLPMANFEAAQGFDSRLRQIVQERSTKQLDWSLTYSAGLACRTNEDATLNDLLRRADEALYRAKREGRNRLIGRDVGDGLDSTDAHGSPM